MAEEDDRNAVPALSLIGLACLGMPPPSTAGFWFEVEDPVVQNDWTETPPRLAYTRYKRT